MAQGENIQNTFLDAVFLEGSKLLYKIWPLNIFLKRRASYHLKAYEFGNLKAFEFFFIIFEIDFYMKLGVTKFKNLIIIIVKLTIK